MALTRYIPSVWQLGIVTVSGYYFKLVRVFQRVYPFYSKFLPISRHGNVSWGRNASPGQFFLQRPGFSVLSRYCREISFGILFRNLLKLWTFTDICQLLVLFSCRFYFKINTEKHCILLQEKKNSACILTRMKDILFIFPWTFFFSCFM